MGDYNANSPTVLGTEWYPTGLESEVTCNINQGPMMRFKSPGAVTIARVHQYITTVYGTPGTAIEVLDAPFPASSFTEYYNAGTDTGLDVSTTYIKNQAGGVLSFTSIDDWDDGTVYARLDLPVSGGEYVCAFRGAATALTSRRILYIQIQAGLRCKIPPDSGSFIAQSVFNLGGGRYLSPTRHNFSVAQDSVQYYDFDPFYLNPSTAIPWTMAEVNNLIATGATDEYGIYLTDGIYGGGGSSSNTECFIINGWRLKVVSYTENRKGYYYSSTTPVTGWTEQTLTGTSALSANTYYYLHQYAINTGNSYIVPVFSADSADVTAAGSASASTGEHRRTSTAVPRTTGTTETWSNIPLGQVAALLDTGTIASQSVPFVSATTTTVYSASTGLGQQITSPGVTTYGAIKLVVARAQTLAPDAPLVVEVRSATGGGGSVLATASFTGADVLDTTPRLVQQDFDAPFSSTAVQYHIWITSTASQARAWKIIYYNTNSTTLVGTTQAEVEGATVGGTTDSYYLSSTPDDGKDLPVALVSAPTTPGSFTATAGAGG
mgnify:FL=1